MKKLLFAFGILFFVLGLVGAEKVQAAKEAPIIFNSGNTEAVAPVKEGSGTPPSFTLKTKTFITTILNYHWNDGKGHPGQGTITLVDSKGETIGSWSSHRPAWEPANKDYWFEVNPNKVLEPGRYTVRDSNPGTWAWNEGTDGRGMSIVKGEAIFECVMEENRNPFSFQIIPEAYAKDSGTRFSAISGDVDVFPDADPRARQPAILSMILNLEDHIKTGEDSSALLSFVDLSTHCLGPESEIILVDTSHNSKLKLVLGNIWTNAKKMLKEGSLNIGMTHAVAGIKGTQFIAETTADRSAIKVIEGSVEFTAKSDGKTIIVNAGEEVGATKDGLEEKTPINPEVLVLLKMLPEKIEGKAAMTPPTPQTEEKGTVKDKEETTAAGKLSRGNARLFAAIGAVVLTIIVASFIIWWRRKPQV